MQIKELFLKRQRETACSFRKAARKWRNYLRRHGIYRYRISAQVADTDFHETVLVSNIRFYEQALLHKSTSIRSEKGRPLNNERLEFLGDSVLSVVVANYLFHHSTRPEGELSRMRASLVSEDALFQFAQEIDLGSYLRLGRGEELGGGRCRPSVVSDAFEATIAALFLDGGIETARNFILPFITEGKTAEDDHKTALQEVVQKHPDDRLTYTVTGESGPAHDKRFQVTVALNGKALAVGEGRSKKAAEQQAAKAALTKLEQQA